jgi:hypothetical protein
MFRITSLLAVILPFSFLPSLGCSNPREFDWAAGCPEKISFGYETGSLNLYPLALNAGDLRSLLNNGTVSTVDLAELYLSQIKKYNHQGAKRTQLLGPPREIWHCALHDN